VRVFGAGFIKVKRVSSVHSLPSRGRRWTGLAVSGTHHKSK
jgi:hypothetical protein